MYTDTVAFAATKGQLIFLFYINGGVPQGCPLFGFLFPMALNPFHHAFAIHLHRDEIMRAFADDPS